MTSIPTISELNSNILSALEAEFNITLNPAIKKFLQVFSAVLASLLWLIYLAIGLMEKNIWVDTCDYDTLVRYGVTILGRYPFPAIAAQYTVTVTGSAGAVIPMSTTFKSDDSSLNPGKLFVLDGADYTLTGTGDTITINAVQGGVDYTLDIGDTLTATAPLANIDSVVTVTAGVTTPINAEEMEDYRKKILQKMLLPGGSWSAIDYRIVGNSIDGIETVYAYATSGQPNEVDAYIQGTVAMPSPGPSVDGSIISNYTAALEAVKPLTVWQVNYYSCPINDVDININMGSFPAFSSTQQALIVDALRQFVNSVHPFIAAADNQNERNDNLATFNIGNVISSTVPGYGFSSLTFDVAGSTTTYWQADNGNICYLNSVNFI